ncbi:MAG: isochorismatase family protein [Burkholderiaceae bacterium]|jgi:nicotinamidase-related amidase
MSAQTALIVVDVQESFRHRPYFNDAELPAFFKATNALVQGFKEKKLPVVRIFHVEPSGAFSHASGFVKPMAELDYDPDVVFEKTVHSALAGTGLANWLTRNGIRRVVISGIRTEQCCETTTRHASDSGFEVDYVTEATLTFPMKHPNGRLYSADEIRERTELVLSQRFATICTTASALERAQ